MDHTAFILNTLYFEKQLKHVHYVLYCQLFNYWLLHLEHTTGSAETFLVTGLRHNCLVYRGGISLIMISTIFKSQ